MNVSDCEQYKNIYHLIALIFLYNDGKVELSPKLFKPENIDKLEKYLDLKRKGMTTLDIDSNMKYHKEANNILKTI